MMTDQPLTEVLRMAEKAFATMGYDLSCCGKAADELERCREQRSIAEHGYGSRLERIAELEAELERSSYKVSDLEGNAVDYRKRIAELEAELKRFKPEGVVLK